jgi:cysteine desulfurase
MIYMDNAATTKVRPEVAEVMLPYFDIRYANPSGIYAFSQNVRHEINQARRTLALSINADENEIFITSGGTESDNWALKMTAAEHKNGHIITTKIEHHAIIRTCKYLENNGIDVTYVDTDEYGNVNVADIAAAIRPETFLISVMAANNEIGTIQPVERIAGIAKRQNILFHTDAVQAYTNIPIDVKRQNIDMLSTSAHKICGPKGIGFLYIRNGTLKTPFINGGGQENGMRSGTENVAGIIGFAKAAAIAMHNRKHRISRESELRNYMINRVLSMIPGSKLNGSIRNRLPNNCSFCFKNIDGAALIAMLDEQGICASAGSACSSASKEGSHVLRAIGLNDELVHGTVRLTLNEEITRGQMDYVIECLRKDVYELRKLSM